MRCWDLQHYGFICNCPACTDVETLNSPGYASRWRRARLNELDDLMAYTPDLKVKIEAKIETAMLMKEEGLVTAGLGDT